MAGATKDYKQLFIQLARQRGINPEEFIRALQN